MFNGIFTEILKWHKNCFSIVIWCFLKLLMEKLFSFKALLNEKRNYRANECGSVLWWVFTEFWWSTLTDTDRNSWGIERSELADVCSVIFCKIIPLYWCWWLSILTSTSHFPSSQYHVNVTCCVVNVSILDMIFWLWWDTEQSHNFIIPELSDPNYLKTLF